MADRRAMACTEAIARATAVLGAIDAHVASGSRAPLLYPPWNDIDRDCQASTRADMEAAALRGEQRRLIDAHVAPGLPEARFVALITFLQGTDAAATVAAQLSETDPALREQVAVLYTESIVGREVAACGGAMASPDRAVATMAYYGRLLDYWQQYWAKCIEGCVCEMPFLPEMAAKLIATFAFDGTAISPLGTVADIRRCCPRELRPMDCLVTERGTIAPDCDGLVRGITAEGWCAVTNEGIHGRTVGEVAAVLDAHGTAYTRGTTTIFRDHAPTCGYRNEGATGVYMERAIHRGLCGYKTLKRVDFGMMRTASALRHFQRHGVAWQSGDEYVRDALADRRGNILNASV